MRGLSTVTVCDAVMSRVGGCRGLRTKLTDFLGECNSGRLTVAVINNVGKQTPSQWMNGKNGFLGDVSWLVLSEWSGDCWACASAVGTTNKILWLLERGIASAHVQHVQRRALEGAQHLPHYWSSTVPHLLYP